jgi:polyphosphate kinase 2 (PPK2 family)
MLETLELQRKLSKTAYQERMTELQERLRQLQYQVQQAELPVIVCLEGWDCSGKGRVIKKLMERLDPRLFRVYHGSAPTPLEQRYHFLWRYQGKLPNDGEMVVFDHSWYGRVLVERCDKLVRKKIWRLAYEQISQFERWLVDDGQVLIKFWLHISKKEQKKRFRETQRDPMLSWKITKEYLRHHKQYDRWVDAIEEMLARTSTPHAPWTLIEAEDMRWARAKVFETLVRRIEDVLTQRQRVPAAVSRSTAAREATKSDRESRKARDAALAREEAKNTALQLRESARARRKREAAHAK